MADAGERDTLDNRAAQDSEADQIFESVLTTLPPIRQWSSATIESLRSAVKDIDPTAKWYEESEWTRRTVNAILAPNEGWDLARLRSCSNADYFSLPTRTIALLNAVFYQGCFEAAEARRDAGKRSSPLTLQPVFRGKVGYAIFRVDYSSDEEFELYKTCWERFMEKQFYMPGALDRDEVMWYWVEDQAKLDGKGPREVRELFQTLCDTSSLPLGVSHLRLCLMVDRAALESMLRVYGPPATEIFTMMPSDPLRRDIPLLPYVTAVSTRWTEQVNKPKKDRGPLYRAYPGHFKFALRSIFTVWANEQSLEPDEYFPRDGRIWVDIGVVAEAPDFSS